MQIYFIQIDRRLDNMQRKLFLVQRISRMYGWINRMSASHEISSWREIKVAEMCPIHHGIPILQIFLLQICQSNRVSLLFYGENVDLLIV